MDSQQFDRISRALGTRLNRRKSISSLAGAAAIATGLAKTQSAAAGGETCTIECPASLVYPIDSETCLAVGVPYPPNLIGDCGEQSYTCDPSDLSTFPVGQTTTVTCTIDGTDTSCTVDVYVGNYTQATLTCPADISIPADAATAVTFDDPVVGQECPPVTTEVGYSCDHASGDVFELGTTTVTCSTIVPTGKENPFSASCTFNVTLAPAPPTATPTETPVEPDPTEIPATEIPETVAPTTVPVDPTATSPVTELPNTGAGSSGSGMSRLLPVAMVGAGAAALARLGLRKPVSGEE